MKLAVLAGLYCIIFAVEVEFADVLEKKNARVSLQQIIRELEATQQTVLSPMIVNGSGFGFVSESLAGNGKPHFTC